MITTKIAFVTYNTLQEMKNGWVTSPDGSHAALIVQDTNGRGTYEDGERTRTVEEIRTAIAKQWEGLEVSLPELDRIVIYVGANGSQSAIERVAKVATDKLTFIGCGCGISEKELMIQLAGLGNARRLLSECGGHHSMKAMITAFLEEGTTVW